MSGPLSYRFTIVDPAQNTGVNLYVPGMSVVPSVHWSVSSVRGDARPFIESPPTGDGQSLDILTGAITDGAYQVRVIDAVGTVGGGTAVNDELDDQAVYSRWSKNGPTPQSWGWGAITYPTTSGDVGLTLGGSHTVAAQDEWITRRTITGLSAFTTYTAQLRYYNRGAAALLAFGLGQPVMPPTPVLRAIVGPTETEATGTVRWPPLVTPPNNPSPEYLQVSFTTDGTGAATFEFGVYAQVGCAWFSWVLGFDWLHITPGSPATTGRYVTINLANANARQQFLGRLAYIETSEDGGTTFDRVLHSGYVTDLEMPLSLVYEYTVGDTRRAERLTKAFAGPTNSFRNVTCLIGGPCYEDWGDILPHPGRPTFVVEEATPSTYNGAEKLTQGEVILKYESGPMPEAYRATGDNLTRENFDIINARAQRFWAPDGTVPRRTYTNTQLLNAGSFDRLRVEVWEPTGIAFPTTIANKFIPWSWRGINPNLRAHTSLLAVANNLYAEDLLLGEGGRLRLPWDAPAIVAVPVVGTRVTVAVYPLDVSDLYPMHVAAHPVAIVADLLREAGLTVNVGTVQDQVGANLNVYLRVTEAPTIQQVSDALGGMFDFSTRMRDGVREFFRFRRKRTVAPSYLIDETVLRAEGGSTYALSESTKANTVFVRSQAFIDDPDPSPDDRAGDDIESRDYEVRADLVSAWPVRLTADAYQKGLLPPTLDAAQFGERPASFTMDGMMYLDNAGELPVSAFARGLAEHVFDRAGRGMQMTTLVCRRDAGVDDLHLGDEVTVDIPHHPNAQFNRTPSSDRGGSRVATVTRRTEEPEGIIFEVTDAGTGTQPFDIEPYDGRWTATVDTADPSIVVLDLSTQSPYTFTNLSQTVSAAGGRVSVYVAFSVGTPTTDEGVEFTVIDPVEYSLDSSSPSASPALYRLGPFPTTTGLWLQIQPWVPGATPATRSSWLNVGGVGLPPGSGDISALVIGTETDTTIPVSWTNTDSNYAVEAYISLAGLATFTLAATLPPGSSQYTFTGLLPGTDYDVRIFLRQTGTALNGSGTTTTTGLPTAPTPQSPSAFAGYDPNVPPGSGTGLYGMQAVALVVPSMMIFETADETVVGSGVPGTFREWTREPGVSGGYTVSQTVSAPNDGKLRYVRAKLRVTGYNDSGYTSPIGIDPWIPGVITPGLPGAVPVLPNPPATGSPSLPVSPLPILVPASRFISQLTATAVASDADAFGTVTVGRGSILFRVASNKAARLRLYDTDAQRTADLARTIGTEADQDDCVLDIVLHPTNALDKMLGHRVVLGSAVNPPNDYLYFTLHNLEGSAADLQLDLHIDPYAN